MDNQRKGKTEETANKLFTRQSSYLFFTFSFPHNCVYKSIFKNNQDFVSKDYPIFEVIFYPTRDIIVSCRHEEDPGLRSISSGHHGPSLLHIAIHTHPPIYMHKYIHIANLFSHPLLTICTLFFFHSCEFTILPLHA